MSKNMLLARKRFRVNPHIKRPQLKSFRVAALYAFVALLGYEYWGRISFLGGFTITKVAGLSYLVLALLQPKKMLSINRYNRASIIVLLFLWSWLLFSSYLNYILYYRDIYFQLTFLQLIILYWLVTNEIREDERTYRGILISFIVGVFSIYILVGQGVGVQASRDGDLVASMDGLNRVYFMGLNPNVLGALAAFGTLFSLYLFFERRFKIGSSILLIISLGALLSLVVISGSAGAFLMLVLGVTCFFGMTKKTPLLWVIYFLAGLACILLIINSVSESEYLSKKLQGILFDGETSGRMDIWKKVVLITSDQPFMGVGNLYRPAHNVFLDFFKWGGLVALLLFVTFCLNLLRSAGSSYKMKGQPFAFVLWICSMFILAKSGGGLELKYLWVIFALVSTSNVSYSNGRV